MLSYCSIVMLLLSYVQVVDFSIRLHCLRDQGGTLVVPCWAIFMPTSTDKVCLINTALTICLMTALNPSETARRC